MSCDQAESVIKKIIREIGQECAAQGQTVSETLVAFVVSANSTFRVWGFIIISSGCFSNLFFKFCCHPLNININMY